jgi:EAL domain-containing protein (putative c-di-GMP-specific phosphodiesterase class I)/GGDEF domain-containing protein
MRFMSSGNIFRASIRPMDTKHGFGRAERWKAFLRETGSRAKAAPGGEGVAAYGASYVRRVEVLAALLAALFPLGFLIDDLVSGRIPTYESYLPALAAMLAISLVARRFAPSIGVTLLFVAGIYAGFALTLGMPNARAVYIVIYIVAVPLFYLMGGVGPGRIASLGFLALFVALGFSGELAGARELRSIVRPYHYAMFISGLLIQVMVAEASERRHARGLGIIFDEHFYDEATGLPNSNALSVERMAEGEILALVRIRNFKDLRSFFDDPEGKAMAVAAAGILHSFARAGGVRGPFRISESEFALVHPGGADPEAASAAILASFADESVTAGSPMRFDVQIGSYRTGEKGEGADRAVEGAGTALANCVATDSIVSHREGGAVGASEDDFKARAPVLVANFRDRSLAAVFQPVYDIRLGGIGFLEALSRLSVGGRMVSPEPYLSAASRLGLEKHFGDFIVEAALDMAALSGHSVSINITFRDLERQDFLDRLFKAYAALSGAPNTLIVELTEQAAFSDYARLRAFSARVHEAGGLIVLDDFGTGYSNYASLLEARFDAVKVAGAIVKEIVARREAAELYFGLCAFCRSAGLEVVAEHISDERIMARALEGGASLLQGYYLSKPIPADQVLSGGIAFPEGFSAAPAPMGSRPLSSRVS